MIAETMILAGCDKECVKIYTVLRKLSVYEGLYSLGFKDLTFSQIQKLDWEVLELKIRTWLAGVGIAVQTLLADE